MALLMIAVAFYWFSTPYREASMLIEAIKENDAEHVERLLDEGIDPNQTDIMPSILWSIVETSAQRPLAVACAEGDYEIVNSLIDHGATAEITQYTGWSPLRETLFRFHPNDVEIVALLIENGADIDAEEADMLPVFAAADMRPMPADSADYSTGYDEKTAKSITHIVGQLLGDNSVNIQTRYGQTLLMYAAQRGNLYLAEDLIDKGCDIYLQDAQGNTAYDYAVQAEKNEMIVLLQRVQGEG